MHVPDEILRRIVKQTTCEWTRGYICSLIDQNAPTRNEMAAELIDSCGPNQKIPAIKKIRANFGLGLKEAKAVVDTYFETGQIVGLPDDPDEPMAGVVRS